MKSILSVPITDLAIAQNGFGAMYPPSCRSLQDAVNHWLRENGLSDWAVESRQIQAEINYDSHSWHLVRDPGSPHQCPENITVCKFCGIEDVGDPIEFGIEYPHCDEVGKVGG